MPGIVARVALSRAIFSDRTSASMIWRLLHNARYHLVENPPQTAARREPSKEQTIIDRTVIWRKATPKQSMMQSMIRRKVVSRTPPSALARWRLEVIIGPTTDAGSATAILEAIGQRRLADVIGLVGDLHGPRPCPGKPDDRRGQCGPDADE